MGTAGVRMCQAGAAVAASALPGPEPMLLKSGSSLN
jgi:hypothetical protein